MIGKYKKDPYWRVRLDKTVKITEDICNNFEKYSECEGPLEFLKANFPNYSNEELFKIHVAGITTIHWAEQESEEDEED
jgi:broad specificity polyphosphatase/5'/3'-nucleotidase SurE